MKSYKKRIVLVMTLALLFSMVPAMNVNADGAEKARVWFDLDDNTKIVCGSTTYYDTDKNYFPIDTYLIFNLYFKKGYVLDSFTVSSDNVMVSDAGNNVKKIRLLDTNDVSIEVTSKPDPKINGTAAINGDHMIGHTETADVLDNDASDLEYNWYIDGLVVGTGKTYVPKASDLGKELTLSVTQPDKEGSLTDSVIISSGTYNVHFEIVGEGTVEDHYNHEHTSSFDVDVPDFMEFRFFISSDANFYFVNEDGSIDKNGSTGWIYNVPSKDSTVKVVFRGSDNDLANARVTTDAVVYDYDGESHAPVVTSVKLNDVEIIDDSCIEVQSEDNVNAGTYEFKIIPKDGSSLYTGEFVGNYTIKPAPATFYGLATLKYTYDGTVHKPAVVIDNSLALEMVEGTDYDITYTDGKNVGTSSVTVAFKGNYEGSATKTYEINPKGTSISSLAKASKAFTVKWKKQSALMAASRISGYQIRYSTSSSMASAKTVTVSGYSKTSKKITKLKAKKKYYVQIRTYKTIGGKKYYSAWSTKKTVKTK